MLSVVIITHNEQDWIENCLRSVKPIADEIIVVDDGSTDRTTEICKSLGAKIFHHDWEGFSKQKNFALTKAHGDWIFFLDGDERISKELASEIKKIISNSEEIGTYSIPRQNIILGKKVRYGGWWPDYVVRLVNKKNIVGWTGNLHEQLKTATSPNRLNGALYHLTHRGITWMLTKSIIYTKVEAKLRFEADHPKVVWWRLFRVMGSEFFDRLVLKSGWRDGMVGVIEAISQAFNMFLIYVHLWEMQQGETMENKYKNIDKKLSQDGF